jgi:hypothetical protein
MVTEAAKHGDKAFKVFGAEFKVSETGVKYHYDNCNDYELQELNKRLVVLKADIKAREAILKAHKDIWVDEETGEEINPVKKTSTTKVTVSIK